MTRCDVVVVGLGAMGSSAAWHLAARGRSVVGLEQFEQGHDRGSSHGAARIFRLGYEEDDYVTLARESLSGWRDLEAESGVQLLVQNGAIDYGSPTVLDRIAAAMGRHEITFEVLEAAQARRRWPGIAFEGRVVHSRHGGRVDADAARMVLQTCAAARGADLRFSSPVVAVEPRDGGVVVSTPAGEIEASVVVVTVNAWTAAAGAGLLTLPPLRVTQEQPAFFAPVDDTAWPSFVRYTGSGTSAGDFACYGLPSPVEGGVKVGEHGTGIEVDPDGSRPGIDPGRLERLSEYVARHLPGLDPEPLDAARCLYATTPTEDFILDRRGPLVVGAGFSGHGFKFTPVVGRILADLADGAPRPASRFSLAAALGT